MNDVAITELLNRARHGDQPARDSVASLLYRELHRLAEIAFMREAPGNTLQPTILVHESFLRLFEGRGHPAFADRAHFLGLAARVMRQILVDHARARNALKRGAGVTIALGAHVDPAQRLVDFLELDQALATLGREDVDLVWLVEMRFIAGMTAEEVAEVRQESVSTVRRDVRYALARLRKMLSAST